MRPFPLIALVVVPLLFSCLPKKIEIPGTEVPSGPLVRALDERRRSFTGLKAVASVAVAAGGKKRFFDTIGIVLGDRSRFRIEAFGPLGQSLFALVWNGTDVLARLPDDDLIRKPGPSGIKRMLGISVEAKELYAVLSATAPVPSPSSAVRAYCAPDHACVLEYSEDSMARRVWMRPAMDGPDQPVRIAALELYRSNNLVYRARYERMQEISRFLAPRTFVLESPGKDVTITVEYADVEVNVPIADDAFYLAGQRADGEE